MTKGEPLNTLVEMVSHLLPGSVRQPMTKHEESGGYCRIEVPPPDQSEEMLTQVRFEPGSTVALLKLGEDPAMVIWGEELPDAETFRVCLRVDGALQTWLFDLEGNPHQLDRAPGAGADDFGDLPVTELIDAPGSRSSGKAVRKRVSAAQRGLLGAVEILRSSASVPWIQLAISTPRPKRRSG